MAFILGIHIGHDASVCLIDNGKVVFALSEERLMREKMYFGFPELALRKCLAHTGLTPNRIDLVTLDTEELPALLGADGMRERLCSGWQKKFYHRMNKINIAGRYFLGKKKDEHEAGSRAKRILFDHLNKLGFGASKIRMYDHHLCHAASAFFCSPFKRAFFITCDGRGDGLSSICGLAEGSKLHVTRKIGDNNSLGQFYAAVTLFLGFRPNRHEGKITGLAAYGDPQVLGAEFLKNVQWNPDGSYIFKLPRKYDFQNYSGYKQFLKVIPLKLKDKVILFGQESTSAFLYSVKFFGTLSYLSEIAKGRSREDIAAGVQYVTERVTCDFIKKVKPSEEIPVVMAGGVFSNVKVNQRVREIRGVSNVFIQPAMGDDGLSLGSSLLGLLETPDKEVVECFPRRTELENVYLGPEYGIEDLVESVKKHGLKMQRMQFPEKLVAQYIHEGKIVGYFQGKMEFGPRALGHRSILVRSVDKTINDALNVRLKRTEFMPFAPSVLSNYAAEYFRGWSEGDAASEYMTMTYDVAEDKRKKIEAVVHVDGTARPQVVFRHKEKKYYDIIEEYRKISGIPVIVNTSFNMHEEPIVCSPEDAIKTFLNGCVDILVINDHVVSK